jgi:CheY-like chemotaxis protein
MGRTVLIVDDDAAVREGLREFLEAEGYRTFSAAHGREALAVLEDELPSLILVDLEMPVMDGWKLLEALQCYQELAGIPTVLMTDGENLTTVIPSAPIFQKPLDLDHLASAIRRLRRNPTAALAA